MAKILVADDNSNIQKMVGLALKDQGIDVVAVGNGEAAVRKISDLKPDLVLADVFMPVRNGYEVCRYVKEDSSLSHIPVILLVGAFDPLDEQEAQRSGADGVLKKPFVPPDPLISMVKSALVRAGVPLGPPPGQEKAPEAPKRSTADILSAGVGSKLAALSAEKIPEAAAEPVEEFPMAPAKLKIAAGSEPLAFGNMLDTTETEEEPILTSKPMMHLADDRKWHEEEEGVEEEKEEEESSKGGWRPGGLDEEMERAASPSKSNGVVDWRDEAFHGNSPAKSFSTKHWAPAIEAPAEEAAEAPSVAVSTVATKAAEKPVPFTSDAWAAAIATGVEEKFAVVKDIAKATPEAEPLTETKEHAKEKSAEEVAAPIAQNAAAIAPATVGEPKAAEPANWAAVPETAWELEARKASLLASTWDVPKEISPDETQEVPVYASEEPHVQPETLVEAPAESSQYSGEPLGASEKAGHAAEVEEPAYEVPVDPAFVAPSEPAPEPAPEPEPEPAPEPEYVAAEPKPWERAPEAPVAPPAEPALEETLAEAPRVEEDRELSVPTEPATAAVAAEAAQADMDELVARVLGKLNPEVLQKVTREILKPVIEAIIKDELNSKKV